MTHAGGGSGGGGSGGTPSPTVQPEVVGGAGVPGVSPDFQPGDHVHAMPAANESNYVANDNTGNLVAIINADTWAATISAAKAPGTVPTDSATVAAEVVGGAAVPGVSTALQRGDHVHAMPAANESNYVANDNTGNLATIINNDTSAVTISTAKAPGQAAVPQNNPTTYYKVYQAAGTTYAVNLNTHVAQFSGTVASTVLNDIFALQSGAANIAIEIDPNFTCDTGVVLITHANIAIYSLQFNSPADQSPVIPNLTFDDTVGTTYTQIQRCFVYGLVIYTKTFESGSTNGGFSFNAFENCAFIAKGGNSAIIDHYETNLTGTKPKGIQYTDYVHCWFNNENTTNASVVPFWLSDCGTGGTVSNGHNAILFCRYVQSAGTSTVVMPFCQVTGALVCGPPLFIVEQLDLACSDAATAVGIQVFDFEIPASGAQQSSVETNNCYWESAASNNLITLAYIHLASGTGTWNGRVVSLQNHIVGATQFTVVDVENAVAPGTPPVSTTKDAGVTFEYVAPGAALVGGQPTIAPGLNPATGAPQPALTTTGTGVQKGWSIRLSTTGGPLGLNVALPTLPAAGTYLYNPFLFPIRLVVTVVGTSTGATFKDQSGATVALGAPIVGREYELLPLEQITFATAWPTLVARGM